jgi:uncharacterized BrkB/YihY/UPF0761 family membrane protein
METTNGLTDATVIKRKAGVPAIVSLASGSTGILAIIIINAITVWYANQSSPSFFIENWMMDILFYLLPVAGVAAIILGIVGIKQAGNDSHRVNRNMSIAGLMLGIISIAFFLFVCVLTLIDY